MSVKQTLENLLQIKGLLREERQAEDIIAKTPLDIEAVRQRLQAKRDEIAEARARAHEAATRGRQIEGELRSNDARLKQRVEQVGRSRTQGEIAGLEAQIAQLRESSAKLEDEGLELVTREEESTARAQALETKLIPLEADAMREIERLEKRVRDLNAQRDLAAAERANRTASLPDDLRSIWERTVSRYGADAIVALNNQATCSGCDMNVIPATRHAVNLMEEIARCEKCGRVLYDPEQVRE
jgi:predicted  nucleic acid-binding Zn-ribbon protein